MSIATDFDSVYNSFRDLIEGVHVSPATLTVLVMRAMSLVEKTKEGGAIKKQLVIRLIERLLAELPLANDVRIAVADIFQAIGPSLIDSLVEADHTQFLKSTHSFFKRICAPCCK